ncbi:MAG: phospholipase D-like domain-containing protein [Gemmataceae bacterium]
MLHPVQPCLDAAHSSEVLFSPEDNIDSRIVALVQSDKRSIDMCVFTRTNDRTADSLLHTYGRGISIHFNKNDDKSYDLEADLPRVAAAGISTCTSHGIGHMHHTFAIFDRSLLLNGSYNWTRGAQDRNCEHVVLCREKTLLDQFAAYFDRRWFLLGGQTL